MTEQPAIVLLIVCAILSYVCLLIFGIKERKGVPAHKLPPYKPETSKNSVPEEPAFLEVKYAPNTPSTYLRADAINAITYDYNGNAVIYIDNAEPFHLYDVSEFKMIPASEVGDFCWTEK